MGIVDWEILFVQKLGYLLYFPKMKSALCGLRSVRVLGQKPFKIRDIEEKTKEKANFSKKNDWQVTTAQRVLVWCTELQ